MDANPVLDNNFPFFLGPANITSVSSPASSQVIIDTAWASSFGIENFDSLKETRTTNVFDANSSSEKSPAPSISSHGSEILSKRSSIELETENDAKRRKLDSILSLDDNYVAFGTLKVYECVKQDGIVGTYIRGRTGDDLYPSDLIKSALNKKWIKLDGLSLGTRECTSRIRVYIIPEDVNRSNRGSVKDFRKFVKYLLNFVDCSTETWMGNDMPGNKPKTYCRKVNKDQESLFHVFNTLDSPRTELDTFNGDSDSYEAIEEVLAQKLPGLRTKLYPYQRRSIAAMVRKEANPRRLEDPRMDEYHDIYGDVFFMDTVSGALCTARPQYEEPQGGILAETMGYGKTLISLALILATRGHYPKIPPDLEESTPLRSSNANISLVELAAREVKYSSTPHKKYFQQMMRMGYTYDHLERLLVKYTRCYNEPMWHAVSDRGGKRNSYNKVYLCSATLIIVPPNLVTQWQQQIREHTEDNALDVLVIHDGQLMKSLSLPQLLWYDIVLMPKSIFEQEYRDDDVHQGKVSNHHELYKSVLTEVRWLRVIVDEGHSFAGSSTKTKAIAMLDKMFIERRWVVSGTPTSGLHGVEIGMADEESSGIDNPTAISPTSRKKAVAQALKGKRMPSSDVLEQKDLERLRLITVNFLKLQPWANKQSTSDKADWNRYLAARVDESGKKHSMPALRDVLQSLIVRHRIEEIDDDITLPPLKTKIVYLKPSYYDTLTTNLFAMVLIANYVTSEREDEDYMFHPRNRTKFDKLVDNMRQGSFYWLGMTSSHIEESIKNCSKYLEKHSAEISIGDRALLLQATKLGEEVLVDSAWLACTNLCEMGTYLIEFPTEARSSWAIDQQSCEPLLTGTSQARYIQTQLTSNSDYPISTLIRDGIAVQKQARLKAGEARDENTKDEWKGFDDEKVDITQEVKAKAKNYRRSPVKRQSSTKQELATESSQDPSTSAPAIPSPLITGFTSSKLSYLCSRLLFTHPEEKTIIFYQHDNIAFFVGEALELFNIPHRIYASTLKPAVKAHYIQQFCTSPYNTSTVSQSTSLTSNPNPNPNPNSNPSTTTPSIPEPKAADIKVLIMSLSQAKEGLHIAAATRIYFVSPVRDIGQESQAIKRAHRIGQTREVFVETLVLEGSIDEVLCRGRRGNKSSSSSTTTNIAQTTTSSSSSSSNGGAEQSSNPRVEVKGQCKGEDEGKGVDVGTRIPAKEVLDDQSVVSWLKNISFAPMGVAEGEGKFAKLARPVPLVQVERVGDAN